MKTFWTPTTIYTMNLLAKENVLSKVYGLVGILALFLFSCEDPSEIGLSLNPDDNIGVHFVELPVATSLTLQDSINTSRPATLLAGSYTDPFFGRVTAVTYAEVQANLNSIADDAVFDSLTLSLEYGYVYGDGFLDQTFTVAMLADTLSDTTVYYNDDVLPTVSTLGQQVYTVDGARLADYPDSTATLTMTLDASFGSDLFDQLKADAFEDHEEFSFFFPGITISGDGNNGSIVGFSTEEGASKLILHYHTAEDTVLLNFPLENRVPSFNHISVDRAGTPLASLVNGEAIPSPDGRLYFQAGTGVTPKLDLSSLYEFAAVDSNANLIINRAEIVINNIVEPPTHFEAPSNILLFYTNETNNRIVLRNEYGVVQEDAIYGRYLNNSSIAPDTLLNPGSSSAPLFIPYNERKDTYSSAISLFTQTLLDRRRWLDQLLVIPASNGSTVNRAILNSDDIKLKIYYTTLKK